MPQLIKMIDKGRFLIELDISWSQLTVQTMYELTKCLAENRTLQVVNLSWNFLTSNSKTLLFTEEKSDEERNIFKQYGNKPQITKIEQLNTKKK